MKIALVTLKSMSAYSQSKHYDVPKLEKESHDAFEKRTWKERLHVNEGGFVFIPPMAFKNCIAEAAKYLSLSIPGKGKATYTKHFEAGILVTEGIVLPVTKEEVKGESLFVPPDGRRGGNRRVTKTFPVIQSWEGDLTCYILDDTINEKVFGYVLQQAGQFIGIGRFRPRNNGFYGRFEVKKVAWSDMAGIGQLN